MYLGSAYGQYGQSICLPPIILMRCRHWNPYAVQLDLLGGDKGLGKTNANLELYLF